MLVESAPLTAEPSRHAQRIATDETLDACVRRETIVWTPHIDGEPVLTPRGRSMTLTWKPDRHGMQVRRHIQDFVDAFMGRDYVRARQAASQCASHEDIREHNIPVNIDVARLEGLQSDPDEMRQLQLEIDRIGEAKHGAAGRHSASLPGAPSARAATHHGLSLSARGTALND